MKSRAILNVKKVELFQILTDYDTQKQLVCLNSNVNFMCHNLLKYLRGFVQKIFWNLFYKKKLKKTERHLKVGMKW